MQVERLKGPAAFMQATDQGGGSGRAQSAPGETEDLGVQLQRGGGRQ